MAHCSDFVLTSFPVSAASYLVTAVYLLALTGAVIVRPNSNCYTFDKNSHLVDFTDWIGYPFEFEGKESDLVVRFCKDVESRSQSGYIDFGRFSTHSFLAGSETVDFIQKFHNGDLLNCEQSFDKLGRTAQVNVICGNCISGTCKGKVGCICGITYSKTKCRVIVELAIPCTEHGPRVLQGFTVGFHPRSAEVVHNGMTQLGFEMGHEDFSFGTEQTRVSLYVSAKSSLSSLIGKPNLEVTPQSGLGVWMSGSASAGIPPTTLSPSILNVDWLCDIARDDPYAVNITFPVEGYDPIEFTLTKTCGFRQGGVSNYFSGWATFGILSCILMILSFLVCCGGYIYKVRVEHQHGVYALPGITILSAFLDAVTRRRARTDQDDASNASVPHASWERSSGSRSSSSWRYGSI